MNLINELNEKKYTLQGLSDHYYKGVIAIVEEISKGGKLDEDTFNNYAYKDARLDHLTYDEFFEMTQLLKRYKGVLHETGNSNREAEFWKKQLYKLTNKALIRRMSQDMCEDDTKFILGQNYLALEKLGYDGRQDQGIPEIVRGNFNMYKRNKEKRESINILNDAIDRSTLYLITVDSNSSIGTQNYAIKQILEDGKSMHQIRKELKLNGRAPFESYKEQYLKDFHEEQFRYVSRNFDVYNEQQKIKDEIMDGMVEVDESTYKRLSNLGYSGKDGHPLIQTGYKMYVDSYVIDKELNYCLDTSSELCRKLRNGYMAIAGWADENSSTRNYVDPMTSLIVELSWMNARSKYKKGKMDKENYDEFTNLMHEMDVAMEEEKIFTAIGEVKKVKEVRERNEPHSREM